VCLGFSAIAGKKKHERASIVAFVTACKARALKQTIMTWQRSLEPLQGSSSADLGIGTSIP
jgi:hypothetical protein